MSLTGKEEAIYVVDGIVTNADAVDPENVESISVLKGPNASALYGMQASSGVIMITTKKGKRGRAVVNFLSAATFDKVAYLPKYQNEYGQGYDGEEEWATWEQSADAPSYFAPMNGGRYIVTPYADESWGPRFDGGEYYPWYAWFPGTDEVANPYYGQSARYVAQPNNIKDYFETGTSFKNSVDISGGGEKYNARVGYVNLSQKGLLPSSDYQKHNFTGSFNLDLDEKFSVSSNINWAMTETNGNFDDGYGNNTTGSFNGWFGRDLEMSKLRELKDLTTPDGYYTSWNWWGPDAYSAYGGDYQKPVFWNNPYKHAETETLIRNYNRFVGNINLDYEITKFLSSKLELQRSSFTYDYAHYIPYELEYSSAPSLYTDFVNSFDISDIQQFEHTVRPSINLHTDIVQDKLKLNATLGYVYRNYQYKGLEVDMADSGNPGAGESVGLVIPDLYNYSNSRQNIVPTRRDNQFKTNSFYSRINLSYKDYLIFNTDIRNDWDSRYDIIGANNSNSFLYGSAGLNFIFSKAFQMPEFMNFGKVWVNYAQTGTEISINNPYLINPSYSLWSGYSYQSYPLMYSPLSGSAANIAPATSSSLEIGTDLEFLDRRVRLNLTYYNEDRKDEILDSEVPSSSGMTGYLANAGLVNRQGLEVVLGLTPVKTRDFTWDINWNIAFNKSKVKELAEGTDSYQIGVSTFSVAYLMNQKDKDWGQLVGNAIRRAEDGTPILNASGTYQLDNSVSFGSVLPDFVGGVVNNFNYKGLSLSGTISFQKGGKFFSLSEMWGTYSGLLDNTVGTNDNGEYVRTPVGDGGGVHVVGVNEAGGVVDTYVEAATYYGQFYGMAEPFIHRASYIKLADMNLSYSLPKRYIGKALSGVSVGVFARNLALLSVSGDNHHRWDPSEMSQLYGENGQLPGTRSFGFNLRVSF
ncbi:TonB-dependent receptor domain-containing protein [Olivibacter sitiensis]|uniref:TonB-dependent receptor domain-containing protein n=1 Tax=Olivibacter sitiensis TaxID=376470 RepID=UPI00041F597D|nr:TonB-dependent receptor [Olivibacter sitiensis]